MKYIRTEYLQREKIRAEYIQTENIQTEYIQTKMFVEEEKNGESKSVETNEQVCDFVILNLKTVESEK